MSTSPLNAATAAALADLAAQDVDVGRMGAAWGARAYPGLDGMAPREAFTLGFSAGVEAMTKLIPALAAGAIDMPERLARLYDPDVLPLPEVPPATGS